MNYSEFLVSVEIAEALKKIGFDKNNDKVVKLYDYENKKIIEPSWEFHYRQSYFGRYLDFPDEYCPLFTYEQVFAWFREKKLVGVVSTKRITNKGGLEYCGFVDDLRIGGKINYIENTPSYESARLNVLNKIIEMYEKKDKTFEFTGETLLHNKVTLNRIRAVVDIPEADVKKGDIGGWIEKEENLSGNAWVYDNSKVYGNAIVYDNVEIAGDSEVRDAAKVYGDACVRNKSVVKDYAMVFGDAVVANKSEVKGTAKLYGNAVITEESMIRDYACVYEDVFIEKSSVYGNASVSGKVIVKGNSEIHGNARVSGKVEITDRSSVYGDVMISGEIKISDEAKIR